MTSRPTLLLLVVFTAAALISCLEKGNSQSELTLSTNDADIKKKVTLDHRIWNIFQDSRGYYWFGSNGEGVYVYDGKQLKQFTTSEGLADNQIRGIQEDDQGNIYIETPKGISQYDGLSFTTLNLKSSSSKWALTPNDLWFNCNGNARHVCRYDGEVLHELQLPKQDLENRLPMVAEPYPYTVFGIDKDKSGNIWFGTVCAGAFRYDGTSFLWIGEEELSTLPDGRVPGVRSMIQDSEGYFWLSNFKSKYKITPTLPQGYEKVKAAELSEEYKSKLPYFNSGIVDNTGDLWMVTYGEGLWKYDGSKLHNYELSNGKEKLLLMCILQDSDGTIWLGTNNDGVYKQNGDNFVKFEL